MREKIGEDQTQDSRKKRIQDGNIVVWEWKLTDL